MLLWPWPVAWLGSAEEVDFLESEVAANASAITRAAVRWKSAFWLPFQLAASNANPVSRQAVGRHCHRPLPLYIEIISITRLWGILYEAYFFQFAKRW